MAGELDAEQVVDLALGEVQRPGTGRRGSRPSGRRPAPRDHADATVARVREEVGHHLEALGGDAGGTGRVDVDELVDGGHVEALRELLLVAQEGARRRATTSRSTYTTGWPCESAKTVPGNRSSDRGRDLVARRRRLELRDLLHEASASSSAISALAGRSDRRRRRRRAGRSGSPRPARRRLARGAKISPFWIWSCRVRMPCISVSGPGGQPGTYTSTGHHLVDALHDRVVVEHAAAARADAHRDDPLGLDHLVVDLAQHRRHLLAHPAGDDHEVGLARAGPEDLHAPSARGRSARRPRPSSRSRSTRARTWRATPSSCAPS